MSIQLKNDCLLLLINKPGEPYRGSRFDYTGQIEQITFLNKHTFCTTETTDEFAPDNKGRGLYNEFGIDHPVGYEECPVGGKFPKIGVGLLTRKSEKPYDFFENYDITPFSFKHAVKGSLVQFICESGKIKPYSFRLEKRIELVKNTFTIFYSLSNFGEKTLRTNEYVHNFLSINGRPIDESYKLFFPYPVEPKKFKQVVNPGNVVEINENFITWNKVPGNQFFLTNEKFAENSKGKWLLINSAEKAGIQEETDFNIQKINLWGASHVISPEIFYFFDIPPGQNRKWSRTYSVFTWD
ncbi:MAG: hypothetical protein R6W90_17450 [Ignavibacteriaceae bacterium]